MLCRMPAYRRCAPLIAGLVLAGSAPTMGGQSLAGAAQAEEARREKNRGQGVKVEVVDHKALAAAGGKAGTVSKVGVPGQASSGAAPPSGSAAGTVPAGAPAAEVRGEAYWRARVREAEARLAEEQAVYDELSAMSLVSGEVYQDSNGQTTIGSVRELQSMTARAKAARDAAKKALDDVHEDARRAGALPGWLR
jgi:hypothetical protein